MKRKYIVIASLIILLGLITMCALPTIRTNLKYARLRPQQEKLAEELEVKIQDYPNERSFPTGYFASALQPGMTINEVHKIVKGYEESYQCWGFAELYYYYSSDGEESIAFMLQYDDNKKYVDLRGVEYTSSSSHSSGGGPVACSPGLLSE